MQPQLDQASSFYAGEDFKIQIAVTKVKLYHPTYLKQFYYLQAPQSTIGFQLFFLDSSISFSHLNYTHILKCHIRQFQNAFFKIKPPTISTARSIQPIIKRQISSDQANFSKKSILFKINQSRINLKTQQHMYNIHTYENI